MATIRLGGTEYPPLGDGHYDVIIFGIGLRESILASMFIQSNKKVLIISKKQSFVWDNTNLDLTKMFNRFREESPTEEDFEALGSNKDYHVDLVPKVIVSYGKMASILKKIGVLEKLSFKSVDVHMSYNGKTKRIGKIPASPEEASRSSLLSIIQGIHFKNLLNAIQDYSGKNTHSDVKSKIGTMEMEALYTKYSISEGAALYMGRSMALWRTNEYLEEEAATTLSRISKYMNSITSEQTTPFLYPIGGKQALCDALREIITTHPETCHLFLKQENKNLIFDNDHVSGVIVDGEAATASAVVGDPSWFREDRQKKVGKVIRSICFINHPLDPAGSFKSMVLNIYEKQLVKAGFKPHSAEINVLCLSSKFKVCPKGITITIISTTVETQKPEKEVRPAIELFGDVLERFDSTTTLFKPRKNTKMQGIWIFKTPDATVTMESIAEDLNEMFSEICETIQPVISCVLCK